MSLRSNLVRISTGGFIEKDSGNLQIVTALKDVSFTINEGDAVGLVGHNGAGKSTLLRTMAGIYNPVSGQVIRSGKVATLLDMGMGMDPELSGYENISRMLVLLGLEKHQIDKRKKDIEDFTQLGNFLQLPVRTYSTGMATRLSFAMATSVEPDILLVDEIFGTGDGDFQIRAKDRMLKLIESVGIFVFASHSHDMVKEYCNRFFYLEHGGLEEISADEL
jgi:ABC-type polysaccharide/polyol phosphate transport system ATPase subunit